jgi:hypothetical protein
VNWLFRNRLTELREAQRDLHRTHLRASVAAHLVSTGTRVSRPERQRGALNVLGSGIGQKMTGGKPAGEPAVIVFVERKLSKSAIPTQTRIPVRIAGVATDVVAVGRVRAAGDQQPDSARTCLLNPKGRQPRPVPGGVSIGTVFESAGTLGYVVNVAGEEGQFVLSNYHVLANLDDADQITEVFQPGRGDGNLRPADRIATLAFKVPLRFGQVPNRVDAALARISNGAAQPFLCGIGAIRGTSSVFAESAVYTFGKESGYSAGVVKAAEVGIVVNYGQRTALFTNQLAIEATTQGRSLCKHGDSGALLVNKERKACGLVFAVANQGRITFANPIEAVVDRLGVRFSTA